jgi:hypothetical protein
MKFTNISPAEELNVVIKNDFQVVNGHPTSNIKYETLNASESAKEYIRHTYREGWKLPDMP